MKPGPDRAVSPSKALQFDRLTGNGVTVAVVDSGIDPLRPQAAGLIRGIDLSLDAGGQIRTGIAVTDRAGHGTACAGIIRKIAPAVELCSVRILDESLRADGRLLVGAIRWVIEQGIDIVNLSLGTTDGSMRSDLLDICDRAAAAGVIVVAAMGNGATLTYPACFDSAISVGSSELRGRYDYIYQRGSEPECLAHGGRQRLRWSREQAIWMGGNSFAAPRISGIVALIREQHPGLSLHGVREVLRQSCKSSMPTPTAALPERPTPASGQRYSWIRKAILFPFTKELHAFVRFSDLLDFEIAGIIDLPLRGNVGKDAGEAIGVKPSGTTVVSSIERVTDSADTLILGYAEELGRLRGDDVVGRWLAVALDRRLHVFSFQSLSASRYAPHLRAARASGLHFVAPEVPEAGERSHVLEPLEPVDVPVLGVFGTSSSQGKFTLQLAMRRALTEWGYRVGQVGTEPHAELLGMDYAFPIGHASTVNLPLGAYPEFLDRKMREICCRRRPDLIIAGSQSGTIPFDLDDPRTYALPSLSFLLGVKPDACVLVVNGGDAESYIRHTIDALGAIGKCSVIALAMSDQRKGEPKTREPDDRISDTELAERLRCLEDRFSVPAASIASPSGVLRLAEQVVERLSRLSQPLLEEAHWQKKRA